MEVERTETGNNVSAVTNSGIKNSIVIGSTVAAGVVSILYGVPVIGNAAKLIGVILIASATLAMVTEWMEI